MPYFIFRGIDAPGNAALRARLRPEHRAHLRNTTQGCRVVAGGPLVDDAADIMTGTILIFEADDRKAAEAFLQNDPYMRESLFEQTDLFRWDWSLGAPDADYRG